MLATPWVSTTMINDALMAEQNKWAREDARIYPDVSTCQFYGACNADRILNDKHSR